MLRQLPGQSPIRKTTILDTVDVERRTVEASRKKTLAQTERPGRNKSTGRRSFLFKVTLHLFYFFEESYVQRVLDDVAITYAVANKQAHKTTRT